MKGPFTTQTLRGLTNSGAMHWRGDRSNGPYGTDPFNSNLSFLNFVAAFQTLIGSADRLPKSQMQTFADFQLQVLPPPNPVRNLDNSLTASQQKGQAFFSGARPPTALSPPLSISRVGQSSFTCNGCHRSILRNGFFGTGGNQSFEACRRS